MDVFIADNGAIGYENIDKSILTYDPAITDAYSQLIDALDTFVIEKYTPPALETTPAPEDIQMPMDQQITE